MPRRSVFAIGNCGRHKDDFTGLIEIRRHARAKRLDPRRRRHDIGHHAHHGAGGMRRPAAIDGFNKETGGWLPPLVDEATTACPNSNWKMSWVSLFPGI